MNHRLIKHYRSTGNTMKAIQFPVFAVCLATPQQLVHMKSDITILSGSEYPEGYPTPVLVSLAREFGSGLVLGPTMEQSLVAAETVQDIFPEYKGFEIVPYMLPDVDNLMTLRRQFDRAGHPTQGFYTGLHWPGPTWLFNPWHLMQQPSISRN